MPGLRINWPRQGSGCAWPRSWLRRVAWVVYIGVNLGLIAYSVRFPLADWHIFAGLDDRLGAGRLYDPAGLVPFVWSPIAAIVLTWVVTIGYWPWAAAHIAALAALRNGTLMAAAAISWPFWIDVAQGNTFTFSVVAGVAALRGSRFGAIAYCALLALMPRPILIPLGLWLVWRDPTLRTPVVTVFVGHAAAVLMTGYFDDWVAAAIAYGSTNQVGIGLARVFGTWGLVVGIPLATWLTLRGRVGWAGIAMSGYLLPQYLLILLVEAGPSARPRPEKSQRSTGVHAMNGKS